MKYIDTYKEFCKKAAIDSSIFKSFRSHPDYTPMLEHVTFDQGLSYLDIIIDRTPDLLRFIDKFKENDKIGSPTTYFYRAIGDISPTTLRYIKTESDLIEIFTTWENETIFELGAGYGGQCKILNDIFIPKKYVIADLPEVLLLIERFLNETNVKNIQFCTEKTLPEETYDLFISNYAFTELDKKLQQIYLDKVISKSTHGYITCNFISKDCEVDSYTKEELLKQISHQYVIVDEFPKTHPDNFLLLW